MAARQAQATSCWAPMKRSRSCTYHMNLHAASIDVHPCLFDPSPILSLASTQGALARNKQSMGRRYLEADTTMMCDSYGCDIARCDIVLIMIRGIPSLSSEHTVHEFFLLREHRVCRCSVHLRQSTTQLLQLS